MRLATSFLHWSDKLETVPHLLLALASAVVKRAHSSCFRRRSPSLGKPCCPHQIVYRRNASALEDRRIVSNFYIVKLFGLVTCERFGCDKSATVLLISCDRRRVVAQRCGRGRGQQEVSGRQK